jgi:TolB-like protein
MIFRFGHFELDIDRMVLREDGLAVAVEPQVFALLRLLVENRSRVVTRDEIIDRIWNGRIVSDSALSSRVKSARQAIGDDGQAQALIRTVHGIGFAFVAEVVPESSVSLARAEPAVRDGVDPEETPPPSRPTLAVLPFRVVGAAQPDLPIADALPQDLITGLSRLRWLLVIARGSSFQFRGAETSLEAVRRKLNVRYCLSGVVEVWGPALSVSVELGDTQTGGVVWSERFRAEVGAIHEIRDQIIAAVTSAVEVRIPLNEAQLALSKPPENLDAWSTYHLGLHHMYRFNKADNDIATGLFERAAAMEPGFARAYAGLSFTHFQNAFLRYSDAPGARKLARLFASQCLERDPLDPFGHFTMGRAQWLNDDLEASLPWLERANALNPNYAQARYSRGWAEALLGNAKASRINIDAALTLSPLDPLVYGMLGVRAMSHLGLEDRAEAAVWAEQAAKAPGAHALIEMIAAAAHGLNGNSGKARAWADSVRARAPHLDRADFLRAFPFRDPPTRAQVTQILERLGF